MVFENRQKGCLEADFAKLSEVVFLEEDEESANPMRSGGTTIN